MRLLNLTAVILPFLGFAAVVVSLWGRGFHWVDCGLLLGMYVLTAVGITVGYHRLFTHRAFETNRVVQFVLAVLGSMAVEGPLLKWVAIHRCHHQHSDTHEDPHSPHEQGDGFLGLLRGLWHAHMGWFFEPDPPNLPHYVKDLHQSGLLRTASSLFPLWVALGVLIPAALGGLLTGTWMGLVRPAVGRFGADILGPSCDLEHQLDLSSLGQPAVPDGRPEPKQFSVWRPRIRRGVAQQPSRLPDLGPLRLAVVANRPGLLVHFRSRPVGPRVKSKALGEGPLRPARPAPESRVDTERVRRSFTQIPK